MYTKADYMYICSFDKVPRKNISFLLASTRTLHTDEKLQFWYSTVSTVADKNYDFIIMGRKECRGTLFLASVMEACWAENSVGVDYSPCLLYI